MLRKIVLSYAPLKLKERRRNRNQRENVSEALSFCPSSFSVTTVLAVYFQFSFGFVLNPRNMTSSLPLEELPGFAGDYDGTLDGQMIVFH